MMPKITVCGKRAGFPFFIYRNKVIIFSQSQWKLRMNMTVSDYDIWISIQRRIKSEIWSAQLSYFNFFLTY